MRVVICGAGKVGASIARYLSHHANDITVIDHSEELIDQLSCTLDVRGIVGFPSHPDILSKANLEDADMIIAVTYSDEVNIVICQIAHSLFKVPKKIARLRSKSYLNPEWTSLYKPEHVPIDLIISPELEVARTIGRGLDVPGAFEMVPFADNQLQLIGIKCRAKAPILNTPLRLLEGVFPELTVRILCIIRGERSFFPSGKDQLEKEDEVYLLIPQKMIMQIGDIFGFSDERSRRLLILGGGNIGLSLSEEIETSHPSISLMVIEQDKERAAYIANQLSQTIVLRGDALDVNILKEANIKSADKVVAVTSDDKVNILAGLLSKQMGAKQSMALVNSSAYSTIIPALEIDSIINPKAMTVSSILHYVRRGLIRTLHSLRDECGEVIEAEAVNTSSVLGMTVGDVNNSQALSVGAIIREGRILMPKEDTSIKVKDIVISIVKEEGIKRFEKLFSVRVDSF